ncbi:MAG TPA: hypothetical protein ENK07_01315 [Bacteroidetes bacterium]|nr:hypothetical protein [Bacteroidota bacterium]
MLNFNWLSGLSMAQAKAIVLGLFALIVLLVWLLPNWYIYRGAADRKIWRNLKIWATIVVFLQAALYWYFG